MSETIYKIPFNKPFLMGHELEYIIEAVQSGQISGGGIFTDKSEALLQQMLSTTAPIILTPSCTAALEMAAFLLEVDDGDEIIMPSYTFVSTATAFAIRGARPVFVDIDSATLNIDHRLIESAITEKTKAIVVVHYGGFPCEVGEIEKIAKKYNLALVEDAAHSLGVKHEGRALGTFGTLGTFSFHETKNVSCGEGGALVINEPALIERAYMIRDKGTNRRSFQKGSTPFYTWTDLGSSYVLSDVLAAYLYGQLEFFDAVASRRKQICELYYGLLEELENNGILLRPKLSCIRSSNGHVFYVLFNNKTERERVKNELLKQGVLAVSHYEPLHLSPFVLSHWGKQKELPITETISSRLLRLPLYFELKDEDVVAVVESIKKLF